MNNAKTFDSFDLTKLICSFFIVVIHTDPLKSYPIPSFYVKDVLARVAVPLFFAISGYLFFRNIEFENGRIARTHANIRRLVRYVRHLSLIYVVTSAFYLLYKLPMWYSIGWWGIGALKDYIVSFFLSGSEYHLWYILASIYGMVLLYLLLSFIRIDIVKYLCIGGWLIECLLYSYQWIGVERFECLNLLTSYFSVCFDAAFRAVPLMAVGSLLAKRPVTRNLRESVICSVLSFVGLVAEASFLYFLSPSDGGYSYILFTPVVTYFIMELLLTVDLRFKDPRSPKTMRNVGEIVYLIHPMVIYLADLVLDIDSFILRGLIIAAVSYILSYVFVKIRTYF